MGYKVFTYFIDIANNVPEVRHMEAKNFGDDNQCLDYMQGEVNRLRNECGFETIPSGNEFVAQLGKNFYNGVFHTFVQMSVIF